MTFGLYLIEARRHFAIRANQVGGTSHTHVFLPVHGFLLPCSVGRTHLGRLASGGFIRKKGKRQLEFLDELHMARGAVWADTEYLNASLSELCPAIADGACLHRTARRVILWIEVKDYYATFALGKRAQSSCLIGSGERGCLTAWIHEWHDDQCTRRQADWHAKELGI